LLATPSSGAPPPPEAIAFFVSKSENRNQVHYAIRLSPLTCAPVDGAPVRAFWRMLERGPAVTEALLAREEPYYGISSQRVLARGNAGGSVHLTLRAIPDRPILVVTTRVEDTCHVVATAPIGGVASRLERVHVQLAWPFGLSHLLLVGARLSDALPMREVVHP